ncbi:sugar ABC transporter ATP-binding protein [Aliagarivorans marinus]|uniref:sugar ABC transporter ATP-binding protein n=1 Tax=Aliagarivorans marinus TaxID=561965 RepID=UPI0004018D00|nr:sugar ABC transporter ATP-binding protein [Aliagarivorans marinus]
MFTKQPIASLSVLGLAKAFSGKTVVKDVSFSLYPGEIVALVGENGAGKSTTKNMLCGLLPPSEGEIQVAGQTVTVVDGKQHGIGAVHQELSLFSSLSVAQNICISDLPGKPGRIDWPACRQIAEQQLAQLGVDVDVNQRVENLGAGKQQIVEIAKALLHASKVLILDEPTTSLTAPERERLFTLMRRLKKQGVAIIFISHFMDEIYQMSDKFICLRDGRQVGSGNIADTPRRELEEMMVGRTLDEAKVTLTPPSTELAVQVERLSSHYFHDISFSIRRGEVLGIAGLMGAGRTEVAETLFGLRPFEGRLLVDGEQMIKPNVRQMKQRGVCYLTEDRRRNGLFGVRSVKENLSAAKLSRFVQRRVKGMGFRGEASQAQEWVEQLNISVPSIDEAVSSLSGGNQQKVLLGRWLATLPRVCILDEPTKGVDIGAKFEIHKKIAALAASGVAVLLVSSDLPELLDLSHRILVMRTGHIVGEFAREDFDAVEIISLAASSAFEKQRA